MSDLFFKLDREELARLGAYGMISIQDAENIIKSSEDRIPFKHNENVVRVYLNNPRTIYVQSIHFYGGEHFNQPYAFIAEVSHTTTESAFSRFMNAHGLQWILRKVPFTY